MKISVRGGGMYGCVIAQILQARGYDVTVYENASDILMGASFRNFRRLHAGFHYPKNLELAKECSRAHDRFTMRYAEFCKPMETHYWIADGSDVTWPRYRDFVRRLGRAHNEIWPYDVKSVRAGIECKESVYDIAGLRKYFKNTLRIAFRPVPADTFVIDCTYIASPVAEGMDFKESTVLHIEARLPPVAQTVLYGPYCGYIPAQEGGFLFYHVVLNDPSEMLRAGAVFFPQLRGAKVLAAMPCRHVRKEGDDRSYTLVSNEREIHVVGGKIAQSIECAFEVAQTLQGLDIMPDKGAAGKRIENGRERKENMRR